MTGTDPSKVSEPPDAADALPDTFLVGFTGDTCITDDGEKGFQKFKDYFYLSSSAELVKEFIRDNFKPSPTDRKKKAPKALMYQKGHQTP